MTTISDADYVCSLDEKSAKKAKDELNEDPKNRLGAVETFRQWILQQPHIKCPTDISFLLPFLRVRYFSQLEARNLLEKYLTRRTNYPRWFRNIDPADPRILHMIDTGFCLFLPHRDAEGRQIFFLRPGFVDTSSKAAYDKYDMFRTFVCIVDYMYLCEEMTTVNGTVTIIDIGGYSIKHPNYMTMEDRRDFIQTWQSTYPARVKQIHMYNTGAMEEFFMMALKLCLPEKIQKRMKTHGQILESLYKEIDMKLLPVEYLPDDYKGPNAGTEQQIKDRMKSILTSPDIRARIKYLSSDEFGIDEKKKPTAAANDVQASFRKLNVD